MEDPGADLEAVRAVDRIVIITGKAEDVEDRLNDYLVGHIYLYGRSRNDSVSLWNSKSKAKEPAFYFMDGCRRIIKKEITLLRE